MMDLNRGDIVAINLNPKKGDEVGKVRPCVIISDTEENQILDTIIVIPLSTQILDNMQPYRMHLKKRGGLEKDSDLLINHIRAISKKRVKFHIASVTEDEYLMIKKNLCDYF